MTDQHAGAPTPPRALTIAGSDSGGGAGLQADLRTFLGCGVHGMTAITAITVQNSLGVTGIVEIPPETVAAQIEVVATDIGVQAAKTGMLANAEIITAIAKAVDKVGIGRDGRSPFVVDPVAASMHGDPLLRDNALEAFKRELFPRATLVTPNLDEVRLLTGIDVQHRDQLRDAAVAMHAYGPQWTLIKSGHLSGDPQCVDLLYDGQTFLELPGPRYDTVHTHGGGDTLASAITSALAKGWDLVEAVRFGKRYVREAVRQSYPLGGGVGPVSGMWRIRDLDEV
ncbi:MULTISPECIES: bifunctional hydroxymethylpyrimidine kinase/phosphomethylpyrimidine kinase [unclassified Crossiella]|uniref:bifunctional hydroxymethylpyrimidine kinase/phosphomethylpyrimidine kinase n=1 Tax=unclassified Crossiella TaxID=2620835 RepID=UPI001FFF22D9|nr:MULTISPECIES: bifunctional hydroxymethylpyrimidine kinase/phosphomethylpyrimidine kinase [unclassified Crossiella]MCK2237899.1 bifunctional hydroxymethylpyrimidine kinase/phosphomethylpyrimidine kinase [Crossiella sp. S99.2]MCK2255185.1 bifunctional hydroxymethylpyrimidine kinase/phosphomethylpyrimidine kinase [Crossiella sp. S99.1]